MVIIIVDRDTSEERFIGPFPDFRVAADYARDMLVGDEWECCDLLAPLSRN